MSRVSRYLEEKLARDNRYCRALVVFVDVVAYSRRPSFAQAAVIEAFMETVDCAIVSTAEKYVRYTQQIDAHLRNDSLVLSTGDGVAVVFPFDGAPDLHLGFVHVLGEYVDRRKQSG